MSGKDTASVTRKLVDVTSGNLADPMSVLPLCTKVRMTIAGKLQWSDGTNGVLLSTLVDSLQWNSISIDRYLRDSTKFADVNGSYSTYRRIFCNGRFSANTLDTLTLENYRGTFNYLKSGTFQDNIESVSATASRLALVQCTADSVTFAATGLHCKDLISISAYNATTNLPNTMSRSLEGIDWSSVQNPPIIRVTFIAGH
jgi:hypothetical protein